MSPFVRALQAYLIIIALLKTSTGDVCARDDGKSCHTFATKVRTASRGSVAGITDPRMARLQHLMQQSKCFVLVKTPQTYETASMACGSAGGLIADLHLDLYKHDVMELVKYAINKTNWQSGTREGEKGIWMNVNGTAPNDLESFCASSQSFRRPVNDMKFCNKSLAKGIGAAAVKLPGENGGDMCLDWHKAEKDVNLPYYCQITSVCDTNLAEGMTCHSFHELVLLVASAPTALMSVFDTAVPDSVAAHFNTSCFVLVKKESSWNAASQECGNMEGRLAWHPVLVDASNDHTIAQVFLNFIKNYGVTQAWMGLRRWDLTKFPQSQGQTVVQMMCDAAGDRGQNFQYPILKQQEGKQWWAEKEKITEEPTDLSYGYVGEEAKVAGFHFTSSSSQRLPAFICEAQIETRSPLITTTTTPTTMPTTTPMTTPTTTLPLTTLTSTANESLSPLPSLSSAAELSSKSIGTLPTSGEMPDMNTTGGNTLMKNETTTKDHHQIGSKPNVGENATPKPGPKILIIVGTAAAALLVLIVAGVIVYVIGTRPKKETTSLVEEEGPIISPTSQVPSSVTPKPAPLPASSEMRNSQSSTVSSSSEPSSCTTQDAVSVSPQPTSPEGSPDDTPVPLPRSPKNEGEMSVDEEAQYLNFRIPQLQEVMVPIEK